MSNRLRKTIFCLGLGLTLLGIFILGALSFLRPSSGRTNFLVLGVAGENYTGSDLTDSIIFVSLENQTGKTLVLSLPRDIWIVPLRAKLNSVYHYEGMEETKKAVGEILGQKIDYSLVIDFNLFTKAVDLLGGVEVEVERSFDDQKYPLTGRENDLCSGDPEYKCRYESLHFEAGKQAMNGDQALKYVRSRNAEGEEGTDFARSQRQQRLLLAIQKKVFTPQILFNPKRLTQLANLTFANIKTDIPQSKYNDLFKIALKLRKNKFKMEVLNDGFLINPPTSKAKYDNQWVLIPEDGTWEAIQNHVKNLIDKF
jgi:LCP family protein required for cell wall assembly